MNSHANDSGFSLVEVMIASVISGIALMGMMSVMEIVSRHVQQADVSTRALSLAQARLEAKRSVRWQALLADDLDHDGIAETSMNDDGQGSDLIAGDGVYTATYQRGDVTLTWTVQADRPGPINAASLVAISATASYVGSNGLKEVRIATVRANPAFVGQ